MALMLDSLPTVTAYSCFAGSNDSDIQLGGPLRPRMIWGLPNIGGGGNDGRLNAGLLKGYMSASSALQTERDDILRAESRPDGETRKTAREERIAWPTFAKRVVDAFGTRDTRGIVAVASGTIAARATPGV